MLSEIWEEAREDLRPSLTTWVGPLLYNFARLLEAKNTLEIGIGRGFTSFALGLYAANNGAKHFTLDVNEDKRQVADRINERYKTSIQFIDGDATDINWTVRLDLIFLDILANTKSFIKIFANFAPKLKSNGLFIIHDYFCYSSISSAVDYYFRDSFYSPYEVLNLPHDGEPRMPGAVGDGPCGLSIVRKL